MWQLFCINIFSISCSFLSRKWQHEQYHFHKLEMFFNLSKLDLIKRFHYMLTKLIVHSIVQKKKKLYCSVIWDHISCFSVKQLKALCFKKWKTITFTNKNWLNCLFLIYWWHMYYCSFKSQCQVSGLQKSKKHIIFEYKWYLRQMYLFSIADNFYFNIN